MITNKDIRVENGNLVLNGDKYPLDGQSPEAIMQIVEDNSDTTPTENSDAPVTSGGTFTAIKDVNNTIGDITQTGVTGATVAAQLEELGDQIADFAVKSWTPKIYDLNTFKRDAPAQKYIKIGALYVMFMEGTFDFSDITTMLNIKNLPCNNCVGGTLYFGSLLDAAKGLRVQGLNNEVLPRPNIISTDLGDSSASTNNRFVFFGYDTI